MSCNSLRTDRHGSWVVKGAPDKIDRLCTDPLNCSRKVESSEGFCCSLHCMHS